MSKLQPFFSKLNNLIHKRQNILFPIGIFLVAIIWRLYRIHQIPAGLSQDELSLVNYLISVTKTGWKIDPQYIYFGLYSYMMAGVGYLLNFKIELLRASQAIIGSFTVYLLYMFVKNWFNRQTALLAGLFFATSSFHVLVSRNIEPRVLTPLILIAIFYMFTVALRNNKVILFAIAGFLLGLSFYVDLIFLFVPVLSILGFIYIYFKNKKIIFGYWKGFLTAFITFSITAFPYFYFARDYILDFIKKFNPGSIGLFYLNVGSNLQSLFYQAPLNSVVNVGTEPIFDPFVSIAFVCGLLYAWFYLRRKKFLLLITWFMFGLVVVSLKSTQNLLDFVVFLPVAYALSSIMLDYVLTHWVRTFPFNKAARLLMTIVFSLFVFLSVFYNYQKYFWAFGRNDVIQSNYQYQIEYKK